MDAVDRPRPAAGGDGEGPGAPGGRRLGVVVATVDGDSDPLAATVAEVAVGLRADAGPIPRGLASGFR